MANQILIKNGTILTFGKENRILRNHSVWVVDEKIKAILPTDEIEKNSEIKTAESIDASGKIVMPGLINAHMHFYSSFARGLSKLKPSQSFKEVLENLWWKLDRALTLEDCYYSAMVALFDAVRSGTTTIIDHHSSPSAVRGSLERIASAVSQVGLRASLCYEVSDRNGKRGAEAGIQENEEFLKNLKKGGGSNGASTTKIQGLFGLHASFTVSEETLQKSVKAAEKLGMGFHVHAAEDCVDEEDCLKSYGCRVVERLSRAGVLNQPSILAHGVHLDLGELEILKQKGAFLVHNPQSNMNNGVGSFDLIRAVNQGVRVGLGTDAMTLNLLSELRTALFLQRNLHSNPSVGFLEEYQTLFQQNPAFTESHFGVGLGRLESGCAADIILIDYDPPTPLDQDSLLGHLVFGIAESRVDTTIASGKVLMKNRKLTLEGLD